MKNNEKPVTFAFALAKCEGESTGSDSKWQAREGVTAGGGGVPTFILD